jgi:8-oxo-dGTP pyrophosphatase MutT (NUDIX family)
VSLHADALAILTAWTPPTAGQASLRDRYVAHLRAHEDGVTRTCFPDHLTASTLVVSSAGTSVLLTLHAKAQRWFQLGGHCEESDPTLAQAALREAVEESGLAELALDPVPVQLSEHPVPFCDPRGTVRHLDVRFVAVADDTAVHEASDESVDVRWWPVDDLPNPELRDLVELATRRRQSTSDAGGLRWAAADQPRR